MQKECNEPAKILEFESGKWVLKPPEHKTKTSPLITYRRQDNVQLPAIPVERFVAACARGLVSVTKLLFQFVFSFLSHFGVYIVAAAIVAGFGYGLFLAVDYLYTSGILKKIFVGIVAIIALWVVAVELIRSRKDKRPISGGISVTNDINIESRAGNPISIINNITIKRP